jgi:PAS domain-containing protein
MCEQRSGTSQQLAGRGTCEQSQPHSNLAQHILDTILSRTYGAYGACLKRREEVKRAHSTVSEQAALLQLAPDALMMTDLDGKVSFWNRGGRKKSTVGGRKRPLARTSAASRPPPSRWMTSWPLFTAKGHWEGELAHVTRGGQTVIVASRWALRREDEGNPNAILEIN